MLLCSLQKTSEGLSVVTDIQRKEEAVAEPKKHAPCCPGHSLVAAEACGEGDQARAQSSVPPPPTSGFPLPAPSSPGSTNLST